jgi:outer membrane biosynthesis protein TonB
MPHKDPLKKKILLSVLCIHALFLSVLLGAPLLSHKPKRKTLVVHTILPTPSVKTPAVAKQSAPIAAAPKPTPIKQPTPPKPQPAPKPTPKKEPAIADKKIAPAKPAPKKQPAQEPRANISDALKKELQESLAKLSETPAPSTRSAKKMTTGQQLPPTLHIDSADLSSSQNDYTKMLVHFLHESLSLPEIGEVKIQLTLRQDGTIAKLVVLKTESQKNKSYLEANLPLLRCPHLEDAKKKEMTFALTFCHEL